MLGGGKRYLSLCRRAYHSAAVVTIELRDWLRFFRLEGLVSIIGWVRVAWQLAEIRTITELSLLK